MAQSSSLNPTSPAVVVTIVALGLLGLYFYVSHSTNKEELRNLGNTETVQQRLAKYKQESE